MGTGRDPPNGVDDRKTLSRSHSTVVEKRELDDHYPNPAQRCQSETQSPRSREAKKKDEDPESEPKRWVLPKSSGTRELLCSYYGPQTRGSDGLDTEELQQVSKP